MGSVAEDRRKGDKEKVEVLEMEVVIIIEQEEELIKEIAVEKKEKEVKMVENISYNRGNKGLLISYRLFRLKKMSWFTMV